MLNLSYLSILAHTSAGACQLHNTEQKDLESVCTLITLANQMRVMITEMVSANIMDGIYNDDLLEAEGHISDALFVNLGPLAGQVLISSVMKEG